MSHTFQPGATGSYILATPESALPATLALTEIIRQLNCQGEPDQTCRNCRQVAAGNFPEYHLVSPGAKPSIGIETVRGLITKLAIKLHPGAKTRVVVFEPANALTTEAQNALLKTIEEPPAHTLILLVTAHPTRLLETVRSRCQTIPLNLPPQPTKPQTDYTQTITALTTGPLFARLLAVQAATSDKTNVLELTAALQSHWSNAASTTSPHVLSTRFTALEHCQKRLQANVSSRAALEALILETR